MDMDNFGSIAENWGFGMAPPQAQTQEARTLACNALLHVLQTPTMPANTEHLLDALSLVKGLFNGVVREDQWDWFTVAGQLGYPSRRISEVIAKHTYSLRRSIKVQDEAAFLSERSHLCRLPLRRCLSVFLGRLRIANEPGAGWIYVLSTRELSDLLKIGMTTKTVEERVRAINSATGVAIPFGVRRCWRVSDPRAAEKLAHLTLSSHRLREDREFFNVPFKVAAELLSNAIRQSGLEIRTLDALGALAE